MRDESMEKLDSTEKELGIWDKQLHKEGIMTNDFEPLRCPMCGGELRYSEGTHDLCCVENKPELLNTETGRTRRTAPAAGFHEPRAEYGISTEYGIDAPCEKRAEAVVGACECIKKEGESRECGGDKYKKGGDKSEQPCVFALSFTPSENFGTLWSIRTFHGRTNYFALMRLIDKIEKRQKRGEPLASNVPNPPRRVERSEECKLAFRYKIEVEDIYSIKFSSETVGRLAMYYGLSEPDIRHIQSVSLGED